MEQRYTAERDVAAGEARLAQLDTALRREEQARTAFDERLSRAYRDPGAARDAFFRTAQGVGERESAHCMRETPETFGELNAVIERRGMFARPERSDGVAREAACEAAVYGLEVIAARRDLARLIGLQPQPEQAALPPQVDATRAQAAVGEQLDGATSRLRALRETEKRMPTHEQLEYRLKQGLRRLSPREFEQLRVTLSPQRLSLAVKLRQMVRDAALGRDDVS